MVAPRAVGEWRDGDFRDAERIEILVVAGQGSEAAFNVLVVAHELANQGEKALRVVVNERHHVAGPSLRGERLRLALEDDDFVAVANGRVDLEVLAAGEATRNRLAALRNDHDACLRRLAEIETFPDGAATLLAARDDNEPWHDDGAALIEAGRDMLADESADRVPLDAMPGARNRIARALAPLVTALQAESTTASADGAYFLPCPDRVLPGDRIRCTVRGRSAYRFSTGGEEWLIEGEVLEVRGYLVSVRITACPDDRRPRPGSVERIPMSELVEFDCSRMLSDDEDERARLAADVRHDIAKRKALAARQSHELGEDHDLRW